jgi:hypothetical protein
MTGSSAVSVPRQTDPLAGDIALTWGGSPSPARGQRVVSVGVVIDKDIPRADGGGSGRHAWHRVPRLKGGRADARRECKQTPIGSVVPVQPER